VDLLRVPAARQQAGIPAISSAGHTPGAPTSAHTVPRWGTNQGAEM